MRETATRVPGAALPATRYATPATPCPLLSITGRTWAPRSSPTLLSTLIWKDSISRRPDWPPPGRTLGPCKTNADWLYLFWHWQRYSFPHTVSSPSSHVCFAVTGLEWEHCQGNECSFISMTTSWGTSDPFQENQILAKMVFFFLETVIYCQFAFANCSLEIMIF